MQETWVRSQSQEDPLEEEMATHSSIFAWRIPWPEEPGGLQSLGPQRVRHNLVTKQQQYSLIYTLWWGSTNSTKEADFYDMVPWILYQSAWADMIEYHRLRGLCVRNLFSHSFGDWNSKNKVQSRTVSGEASLLGLQIAPFFLVSSLCVYSETKRGTSACLFLVVWRHQPSQIRAPLLPRESVLSRFSHVWLFATLWTVTH